MPARDVSASIPVDTWFGYTQDVLFVRREVVDELIAIVHRRSCGEWYGVRHLTRSAEFQFLDNPPDGLSGIMGNLREARHKEAPSLDVCHQSCSE